MSFPRYPKYKDSGVAWVGDIPDAWRTTRLKNLFELMRRDPEPDDEIVTAFRDGEVTLRSNRRTDGFTNAVHEHGYQRVLPDDLVIHAMDAFAGAIGASDSAGKSTPVYSVCRQRDPSINVWYFARLLRHMALSGFILSLAKGIRERSTEFRWNEAASVLIPVPSSQEQRAIAAFLDRETAKIDALVAEQRRLIELLQEKRQAVISHAVTKGLNPDAPMKPSGYDWLGEVPEHWEVKRLKRLVASNRKITYGIVQPGDPDPAGRCMIRGKDYSAGWCQADDIFRVSDAIEIPYTRSRMQTNDLVMTIVGAGVGTVAVIPDWLDGSNITQTSARISIDPRNALPHFVCYSLQGIVGQRNLERNVYGSAQPRLNIEHVDSYIVTVPPINEQNEIVARLDLEIASLSELSSGAERAIDLLKERRTALISAAVTGKIDVRGLVDISGA